ncbi:MAG TPA: M20/M25/M40 family metallo-hydrolase [Chloroflexia bacterium]|nr:M20/M25/M40 family metallo-hydrolase [Chloroflexia bacterium]
MPTDDGDRGFHERPAELLQHLIRYDTTNPPGNEAACVSFIQGLLENAGIETTIRALDPNRPSLIARLKGRGDAPPFLMQGHVDVVTTEKQDWTHPPFSGDLIDGYVWGRGALDMKGAVACMVAALLRAVDRGMTPAGDILLAVLPDEEAGGDYGARWLVKEHPELFEGVRYSIGEAGGETTYLEGRKLYPIQVSEKQRCEMRAVLRGPGGHGSLPTRGGAMGKLGKMLSAMDANRLPVRISEPSRAMVEGIAAGLDGQARDMVLALLDPEKTNSVLDRLGIIGRGLDAVLHNTANATIVSGGYKVNVIPSEITVGIDGRLVPGATPDDMIEDLRGVIGYDADLEVVTYDPYDVKPDMKLYGVMADILKEADPEGTPFPYVLSGVTDGRHFAKLGIQNYGFTPLLLPDDPSLVMTVHDADERVPAEALDFGVDCTYKLLERYGPLD